jgi:murein L,D-transpeptidase YafK
MRRLFVIFLIAFSSCRGEPQTPQNDAVNPPPGEASDPPATVAVDQPFIVQSCDPNLPGPERAKAAADRVRPELEKSLAAAGLRFGDPVFLRAFKEEGELEMWILNRTSKKYDLFRTWKIAAASGIPGPKLAEGDNQVPEGFYFVPPAAMKPDSVFHLAFNIGFPNDYDRAHHRTGTFIMIHGNRVSIGCLAMTDEKIEEIYTLCAAALKKGQPFFRVNIFPFRMTEARMATAEDSPWFDFWKNLREGYDRFEQTRIPPETTVVKGRYTFR